MERCWYKIKGITGKTIDGVLTYPAKKKLTTKPTIIIFMHGLLDSMQSYIIRNTSQELAKIGYTTFIYNQYGIYSSGLNFSTLSLNSLVADMDIVIDHFTNKGFSMILVGHSFGCFVGLMSKHQQIPKILLEPSIHPSEFRNSISKKSTITKPTLDFDIGRIEINHNFCKDMYSAPKYLNLLTYSPQVYLVISSSRKEYWNVYSNIEHLKFTFIPTDHWFTNTNIVPIINTILKKILR
ncbi:MAG: alpha/beta hydrolase [Candidatus Kuenenia stuttgartiensis]|nr:alpha/beta hydrolase [Candidatus Kuenenia stuttgartiensis]